MLKKILCVFAIGIFVFSFVGCGSSDKESSSKATSTKQTKKTVAPKPKTLESLVAENFKDGKITKNGNELTIQFTGDNFSEDAFVTEGLNDVIQGLSKTYKNEEFKKFKIIHVSITAKFTDKYGNNNTGTGIGLTFDQSELQKVNDFGNIVPEQLIKLQGNYRTGSASSIRENISPENYKILYPND